jgi:glycolate oxidase FAD binding subunit
MPTSPLALEQEFRAILGFDSIRAATSADAVADAQPKLVLEPANEQQLAAVLRLANDAGLAVIPRGGGTKLNWGNPPRRADLILSTARLDKIIEHPWADLTVSVEAGCTIQKLQSALSQHGQRLALDPLWPENATIGGVLSTNDSGTLRLRFGALRDLIIGVTIALPDGTLASSGGKVVKNVAGYDLPKLVTGAFGTLGVITRAVFRLHPLPRNTKTFSIGVGAIENMQQLLLAVQNSQMAHTSLQARIAQGADPIVDILFEGTEAGIAAQEAQLRELAGTGRVQEAPSTVRYAAHELWNPAASTAISKISVLPAAIARTVETVERSTNSNETDWKLTMQATGLGWLQLDGAPENVHASLLELRREFERDSASLTVLHRPAGLPPIDTWGEPGDALPLMRAVKHQFDPRNTLNPGRFVGGI